MAGANPKNHISYSELWDWVLCPKFHAGKHILKYVEFKGSIHTCFGTAMHDVAEHLLLEEYILRDKGEEFVFDSEKWNKRFSEKFKAEIASAELFAELDEEEEKKLTKLVEEMEEQGPILIPSIVPSFKKYFGDNYEVISTEQLLLTNFVELFDQTYDFKGYVDLIIKDSEGVFHAIDHKTCSWGWKPEKKSSKKATYQLTYYKHFLSQELEIDLDLIKCHFALFKRTAGATKNIEIFEVPIGKRKIKNALKLLKSALYNIHKGKSIAAWNGCNHKDRFGQCPFANTKYCNRLGYVAEEDSTGNQ